MKDIKEESKKQKIILGDALFQPRTCDENC